MPIKWWDYRRRAFESADEVNRLRAENSELQDRLERAEAQRDAAIAKSCELAGNCAEMAAALNRAGSSTEPVPNQTNIESPYENGRAVVQREMAASIREIAERLAGQNDRN